MKYSCIICMTLIAGALFLESASAQVATPTTPPTTAAAEVTGCAQAQMVVDSLLSNANARIESARQSNNPAEMRATVDAVQTTIRDVRAQLAACANTAAADPHAGHTMPGTTTSPGVTDMPVMKTTEPAVGRPPAPTPADPHAGHTTAPGASTAKPAAPARAGTPTSKPATGPTKPAAADPHAGHAMAPAKPAPKAAAPPTSRPSTAKPAAPDPHAGHAMTPVQPSPKSTQPAAKPAPATKPAPADPHAGHGAAAAPQPAPSGTDAKAVDPVCGLRVDPGDAPSSNHGAQTYYFCSTKHRDLFVGNPAKYLPKQ